MAKNTIVLYIRMIFIMVISFFTSRITLEQLGVDKDKINAGSDVVKDLGADSIDVVQLLMAMEDEFGVTVTEDDASNLKTVEDIVSLIDNRK